MASDRVSRVLDLIWPGHPTTWRGLRTRLTPRLVNYARMTTGGVLAYLVSLWITSGNPDLTGALTALLVMQASASGSLRMGLVRVGAVLTGVLVAIAVSSWVGLTWWSLGIVIFASLVLGKALRLGDQVLETPISGMLILAATVHGNAAEIRLLSTLVGTVIGIALPLVWPPAIPVPSAAGAIRRVAADLARVYAEAAERFEAEPITRQGVDDTLEQIQRVTGDIGRASEAIDAVRDTWALNVRTIGRADLTPLLRSGLESLQNCAAASRALFRAMQREVPVEPVSSDAFDDDVRAVFVVVLGDISNCLTSYGSLLEAETRGVVSDLEDRLRTNLELVGETRAMLTELMLVDTGRRSLWMVRGSVLRALDEVLAAIDVDSRAATRGVWRSDQGDRPLPSISTVSDLTVPLLDRTTLDALRPEQGRPRKPGRRST